MDRNTQALTLVDCLLEDAYIRGYSEATERARKRSRAIRERKARKRYFIKQKLCGLAILLFTPITVWALDGDATFSLFAIPLGIALLTSRQMLIVNQYYFEHEEKNIY